MTEKTEENKEGAQAPGKAEFGKCPVKLHFDKGKPSGITFSKEFNISTINVKNILQRLTATQDNTIATEIYERGLAAMPQNFKDDHNMNLILQTLADSEPKDATESRLCLQANALYAQGMQYLGRAEKQDMMPQAEYYMKFATKLLRLHLETIEALNKYRRKGEQRVVVSHQHVTVNDGGQAAIMAGEFKAEKGGGRGKKEMEE